MKGPIDLQVSVEPEAISPPGAVRATVRWRCTRPCTVHSATVAHEICWEFVSSGYFGVDAGKHRHRLTVGPDGSERAFEVPPASGVPFLLSGPLEVGAEGRDEVTVPIPRTHPSVERPGLAFRHFVRADVVTVDPAGHATAKAQLTLLSSRALYEIAARTVPRVKGRDPGFATRFLGLTISTPANTVRPVRASDVGLSLGVPDRSVKVGSRVGGTVRVSEPVHRLSVSLVRKESRSHGLRDDQSVSDAHRVATTQLEAAAGIDIPFSLEVPPDAVPTVLAAQRSIRWYVNGEAAPKGLLAPSAETEVELNVYNGDG